MSQPDFIIARNDTASGIYSTLENSGGTAVSVQGATVLFKMAPVSGTAYTVAGTATIDQVGAGTIDGTLGDVHYNWKTGETGTSGLYRGEWEVTFSSGTVQTFPNTDPILILITADL